MLALALTLALSIEDRQAWVSIATAQADAKAVLARLTRDVGLAPNVAKARERAQAEKRAVLAIVVGRWKADEPGAHDELVFGTVLAHPDVRAIVAARCVPVVVACTPNAYAVAAEGSGSDDPLATLGAKLVDAKPPALVLVREDGVAVLASIGTWDAGLVARFLVDALGRSTPPKALRDGSTLLDGGWFDAAQRAFEREPPATGLVGLAALALRRGRADEALEILERASRTPAVDRARTSAIAGSALLRLGRLADARAKLAEAGDDLRATYERAVLAVFANEGDAHAMFDAIAKDAKSPWGALASAWIAWPERMRALSTPGAPAFAKPGASEVVVSGRAEERRLVETALDYLTLAQMPDGSWPLGSTAVEDYRGGVAALAADALLAWRDELDGARKERVASTLERAERWLAEHVAKADAAELNSFAAAYWVDHVLARRARGLASAEELQAAADLLAGGRMENGAWSYSKRFGETWKGGFAGWPTTDEGRAHSMNTAIALDALARAKAAGARVDEAKLAASTKTLLAMRVAAGRWTYTWPEPRNFEDLDASIARASACERALWRMKAVPAADVRTAIDAFLGARKTLRVPVKLSASWLPPHGLSSYFWFFAYDEAARALVAVSDAQSKRDLAKLRADVLSVVEPDGTWVDFEDTGKPYGTAMALRLLALTATK